MRCEPADELPDGRLVVASAERNRGPILKVLERAAYRKPGSCWRSRAAPGSM